MLLNENRNRIPQKDVPVSGTTPGTRGEMRMESGSAGATIYLCIASSVSDTDGTGSVWATF